MCGTDFSKRSGEHIYYARHSRAVVISVWTLELCRRFHMEEKKKDKVNSFKMVSPNEVDSSDKEQKCSADQSDVVKKDVVAADTDESDLDDSYVEHNASIASADTESADSDIEEVELDKSLFKSPPRRRFRWMTVISPRWNFVPPVFRDGHWVMPIQQCDANLSQTVM